METSAKAKAIGQRGKSTEGVATKLFNHLNNTIMNFAFERLPDARAAGGRLKAQLCDFLAWWSYSCGKTGQDESVSYQIEVKEIAHAYRLPKDKLAQLPRLRKVARAGGTGLVIIHHTSTGQWRVLPIEHFNGEIPASWDLSRVPQYPTIDEALNNCSVVFPNISR